MWDGLCCRKCCLQTKKAFWHLLPGSVGAPALEGEGKNAWSRISGDRDLTHFVKLSIHTSEWMHCVIRTVTGRMASYALGGSSFLLHQNGLFFPLSPLFQPPFFYLLSPSIPKNVLHHSKWQPTPAFLPGESHGQRSLAGYSSWGCKKLGTT